MLSGVRLVTEQAGKAEIVLGNRVIIQSSAVHWTV